jgi:hypothetical protein
MRFARNVHFQIKSGKEQEFNRLVETDILPMLRRQNGFKEEVTLIDGNRALGITLWADRGSAETYSSNTYPRVLEKLNPVLEGSPKVEGYQIGATTLGV